MIYVANLILLFYFSTLKFQFMKSHRIIGLMSGTSLDGLDLAYVHLSHSNTSNWKHELIQAQTIKYPPNLAEKLKNATELSAVNLFLLDKELGRFFADCVNQFIKQHQLQKEEIDALASHGQTIYHQPEKGITVQIGCGATISLKTGLTVVNDFRTKDVILGGQGAPLVPIGDFMLFEDQAESFLNIGGISNISFRKKNKIHAYDVCPGNLALNKLANNKELAYDKNGDLARTGEINFFLLDLLNNLEYYAQEHPKSLGVEWLEQHFYPLIKFDKDIENNLRTVIEHQAYQIGNELNKHDLKSVFITGGGALNGFFVERIKHYFSGDVRIPDRETIEFKEAIIFAFLAALRLEEQSNCISSVTGAERDVCGGTVHQPF